MLVCHKVSQTNGLNYKILSFQSSGATSSRSRCWQVLSKDCEWESVSSPSLLAYSGLLASFGIWGLVKMSPQTLPSSSYDILCVFKFSILIGIQVLSDEGPTLLHYHFTLTNYIYNGTISKWSHVLRYQGLGLHEFWGNAIQPITIAVILWYNTKYIFGVHPQFLAPNS